MTYDVIPGLARAVARGWLSLTEAHVRLMVDASEAERAGHVSDTAANFRFRKHLLGERLRRERMAMAIVTMKRRWAEREASHGR